ncbi:hypothetical protein [Ornithinimicrobium sp. INDO-MA30-4]|uniref:hypothetical protein n=1 Tax=Ornithinimicrobium sp. INDO-MA30-4 TaxID=2908651 RepID=UPI001F306C86|nr:hypothetical protein [Ornithinimicrobium sp. INDO-MA30-4]UJH70421.1 hypothetical protein L0A91_15095 [Ornithinimicrobium sp. INDO-MA30-4]
MPIAIGTMKTPKNKVALTIAPAIHTLMPAYGGDFLLGLWVVQATVTSLHNICRRRRHVSDGG